MLSAYRLANFYRGVENKVLFADAPPRGQAPFPFVYHLDRKGTSFVYL